jgi:hypothetical protein
VALSSVRRSDVPVFADSVHAGPIEWRYRVDDRELTYLDQESAYLAALEAGVPGVYWRWWSGDELHPDQVEELADPDPEVCAVLDATWWLPAPCLPRRLRPWGPTVYEVGVLRTTVRTPLVRLALQLGGQVLKVHGLGTSRRLPLQRFCAEVRHLQKHEPDVAKALYQRLWGKLLQRRRTKGIVLEAPPTSEEDAEGRRISIELDDQAQPHAVEWMGLDDDRIPPVGYRPDLAGEVVAHAHARTLAMAHELEAQGRRVPLLHVDAVVVEGPVTDPPDGWAVKAHGRGSVYGHGRYQIQDPDRGYLVGRMGLHDGEPLEHAHPDQDEQRCHSRRRWLDEWTSVPWTCDEADRKESHRSGPYPWELR